MDDVEDKRESGRDGESARKVDPITHIMLLVLSKNGTNLDMSKLLDLVGSKMFVSIVTLFSNRRITFPSLEELKDAMNLSCCYYYRQQGKSWEDIRSLLGKNEFEINSISYGMKINSLNKNIRGMIDKCITEGV